MPSSITVSGGAMSLAMVSRRATVTTISSSAGCAHAEVDNTDVASATR